LAIWASTVGVALPGDERFEHLPSGDPEDVRDHRAELYLGVFEQFLHPLHFAGAVADQRAAVAGQVP
jgi:hypothetical protein